MSTKTKVLINHKTGSKVTTTVSRSGNTTRVVKDLKKSDGLLGTRFLGTNKRISDKTYRKG